jgi:hypothetical protein
MEPHYVNTPNSPERQLADDLVRLLLILKIKNEKERMRSTYRYYVKSIAENLLSRLPLGFYWIVEDVSMNPRLRRKGEYYVLSVEAKNIAGKRELHIFYF